MQYFIILRSVYDHVFKALKSCHESYKSYYMLVKVHEYFSYMGFRIILIYVMVILLIYYLVNLL